MKTKENLMQTIAHEIGHVMMGYGHPNIPSEPGPAPLDGTPTEERLMHSLEPGKRLVKAEWDTAEAWLKARPNGDN